jgi:hypothetical protein
MNNSLRIGHSFAVAEARRDRLSLRQVLLLLAPLAMALAASPAQADDLVITPIFDTSITSQANAAAIENSINQAIGIYESLFTDNITVSILFRYSSNQPNGSPMGSNTLAQSNFVFYPIPGTPTSVRCESRRHDRE